MLGMLVAVGAGAQEGVRARAIVGTEGVVTATGMVELGEMVEEMRRSGELGVPSDTIQPEQTSSAGGSQAVTRFRRKTRPLDAQTANPDPTQHRGTGSVHCVSHATRWHSPTGGRIGHSSCAGIRCHHCGLDALRHHGGHFRCGMDILHADRLLLGRGGNPLPVPRLSAGQSRARRGEGSFRGSPHCDSHGIALVSGSRVGHGRWSRHVPEPQDQAPRRSDAKALSAADRHRRASGSPGPGANPTRLR